MLKKNEGHPGFAWASTRWALEKTNGLIDQHILGSSDYLMALALIHKIEEKYLIRNRMSLAFLAIIKSFEENCSRYMMKYSIINVNINFIHLLNS